MESPLKSDRIYVAGHNGFVGSAVVRSLKRHGYSEILTKSRDQLDLLSKTAVRQFFKEQKPNHVILAAAKVGGIGANSKYLVEFLLENLEIQNNVISAAADFNVKKLVFLGSSCIYPKAATYPITEDQLLTGPFEPTNEPYALAKVAGIKLCQSYFKEYQKNFISVMPTNVYGPNERYDSENSHVIPSMMVKVFEAIKNKRDSVTFWGSGKPLREFIHSDDLADGIVLCFEKWNSPEIVNIGSQQETSIFELAQMVCRACDFKGKILWDASRPDGVQRKVMDSSRLRSMNWEPKISLEMGLKQMADEARKKFL